jgi:hypothetical protein
MKFFKRNGHYQVIFFNKEVITRSNDEKKTPYLVRYTLVRLPWFQILFHKFLISDDDCLHDHPWPFISVMLWGGYYEWCRYDDLPLKARMKLSSHKIEHKLFFDGLHVRRRFRTGQILYRPAEWKHRVELITTFEQKPVPQPAYSMLITFNKQRTWGFWTKQGFIKHYDYDGSGAKCD